MTLARTRGPKGQGESLAHVPSEAGCLEGLSQTWLLKGCDRGRGRREMGQETAVILRDSNDEEAEAAVSREPG